MSCGILVGTRYARGHGSNLAWPRKFFGKLGTSLFFLVMVQIMSVVMCNIFVRCALAVKFPVANNI
jgi:hypothetical protein